MRNPHYEVESNMAATSIPPEILTRFMLSNHNPAVLQQYWQERYYSAAGRASIQQEYLKQYSALQYSRFQAAAAQLAWRHSYGRHVSNGLDNEEVSRRCVEPPQTVFSRKGFLDPASSSSSPFNLPLNLLHHRTTPASPDSTERNTHSRVLKRGALEKLTQFTSSRLLPPPLLPIDSDDPHSKSCDHKSCDPKLCERYVDYRSYRHYPRPPPPLLPLHQEDGELDEGYAQGYNFYSNKRLCTRGLRRELRRASPQDRSRSPDNHLAYVTSSNQPPSSSFNGLSPTSLNGTSSDVAWTTLTDRRSSSSMQGNTDLSSGGESSNLSIPSSPLTPQSMGGGGKKKLSSSSGPPLPSPGLVGGQARAGKSIEEELCLICGDRASGYHYNALSCEGCKGFFRRSITRGATYNCKYGGHCEMDMWMRRRCQACRLRRCKEVGMKEECLLSDEQCAARDARRKARQRLLKLQQGIDPDAPEKPNSPDSNMGVKKEQEEPWGPVPNPLDYLNAEERELIESIVIYQDEYELPNETDVKKLQAVKISDMGRPKEVTQHIYKHMAEMTILVTQLVVAFAKNLPGFMSLDKEDQIVLLKGSASEVMILRTARRYNNETDSVVFANGMPFTKTSMRYAGLQTYVDSMFDFCRQMGKMAVDNAEYALLTAICIFSDRPGLSNVKKVEAVQELYLNTMLSYQRWRRPKKAHFLAKLLLQLVELRSLSAEHSDVLFSLKVEKGSLPPLLSEYFDVVD